MTRPFPGMDPFLENPGMWSDFHMRFINYLCESLADSLPPDYEAGLGDRIYLVEQSPAERKQIALIILDEPREPYIEILHYPDRTLVTVIELLSPANKEEPGRSEYLAKRNAILRQNVNLVELDLLRGGGRLPLKHALPSGNYYAFVARAVARPDCDVYPWTLRQAWPPLPIPLRAPERDVVLQLSEVFATAYTKGRYGRRVDYQAPLVPSAAPADDAWVRKRIAARRG